MTSGLLGALRRADSIASGSTSTDAPAARRSRAAGAPGLVPYKTTGKSSVELVPAMQRVRRLRTRIRWTAKSIEATGADGFTTRPAMLTLTYTNGDDWQPDHVKDLLGHVRKYLKRRHHAQLRYVWVAELQQRGAVHYHIVIWLPKGVTLPKPDKQGWWPHGATRIEWVKSAVRYVTKYATKLEGKDAQFPPGLRLHGSGGVTPKERRLRAYLSLPKWLNDQVSPTARLRPQLGGGWADIDTGEFYKSPFEIDRFTFRRGVGVVVHLRAKESHK